MTATEALYNFNVELNTIYRMPNLEADEALYWVNKAQDRFVTKRYTGYSVAKGLGVESSQKRIDDLRPLVRTMQTPVIGQNPVIMQLPSDYMHLLRLVIYTQNNCVNDLSLRTSIPKSEIYIDSSNGIQYLPVYCKQAQHDDLNVLIDDPFNTPVDDFPLYTLTSQGIELYLPPTSTIVTNKVYYIRKPSYLTVNELAPGQYVGPFTTSGRSYSGVGDLADYCYTEIIDNAIAMYIQSINLNKGYATDATE